MSLLKLQNKIYQTEQIRQLEHLAQTKYAVTGQSMMNRAGAAAFDILLQRWPQVKRILVICGNGNNGGDGYVVAKLAYEYGIQVGILQVGDHSKLKTEAAVAYDACQTTDITFFKEGNADAFKEVELIVDAICGIGLQEDLREPTKALIDTIQQQNIPILALDIPSGIAADTGKILGAAIRATTTITFLGLKLGLLTGNGVAYTGELFLSELQLPPEIFTEIQPVAQKIQISNFRNYLKPRLRNWHKGLSGHVLIIGGDLGYSGAPRMAAEAALRVGAGLVTVATRPENANEMNLACPEIMCRGITKVAELKPLLEKADVIVIGPGLGQDDWGRMLWKETMKSDLPMIVDADGLNLLAKQPSAKPNWILTPHPGEAARLLQQATESVQHDRLAALKAIQAKYQGTCILKGAGTLILGVSEMPALCDKGNPGMATAGMGDVLSGILGGLLGQKVPLEDAAKLGVYLHAVAGDLAAKEGERGLLATDLMPYIRLLSNDRFL